MSTKPATERPRPPSVERILAALRVRGEARDHAAVVSAIRAVLGDERTRLLAGEEPRATRDLVDATLATLDRHLAWPSRPVINATGVILHTNLGRAPWPGLADVAVSDATGYLMLELDPETGRRGARTRVAEEHLIALTGAEDAFVTNNNAAALALAVGLAGRGRGVVVSRGELVEIGGGVRIPDIIRRAGARLVEVGTTNRTRASDVAAALEDGRASMVLRVHPSNFTMDGFVESPDPTEVAATAHAYGAIVVDDLGSGALLPTEDFGLAHEPMPGERLAAGADLVTFSGDKLVGGPQAGLVVGRADLIARLRRDPFARAMRPDKSTLLAMAMTLGLYRAGLATTHIPVWRMIATPLPVLRDRATRVARWIGPGATVVELASTVGGGSLPEQTLASAGIALDGRSAARALDDLRRCGRPSVIGRIDGGRVVLDLRTVDPEHDRRLAAIARVVLAGSR